MKRIFFILMALIAIGAPAVAQTVESIRKDYTDAKDLEKRHKGDDASDINVFQTKVYKMWPGSGPHAVEVTMYCRENEDDENYDAYLDNSICFVTTSYNVAARSFYEEYLYNRNEKIEFIYARGIDDSGDEWTEYEYRFYFGANGVIKLIVKRRPFGDESQFAQEYSGATVPDKYKAKLKELQSSSKYFKDLFDTLDNL
ncbi:MAG: hypothetical protein J6U21_06975 [Bacteroidales bacterium]|nr:hypothetical protein [Bacteroidales bacterium]